MLQNLPLLFLQDLSIHYRVIHTTGSPPISNRISPLLFFTRPIHTLQGCPYYRTSPYSFTQDFPLLFFTGTYPCNTGLSTHYRDPYIPQGYPYYRISPYTFHKIYPCITRLSILQDLPLLFATGSIHTLQGYPYYRISPYI
jgi:hypothetical protein